MIKLTGYQRDLLVQASKTPGTEEDKRKAIDQVVEALKSVNPGAFQPEPPLSGAPGAPYDTRTEGTGPLPPPPILSGRLAAYGGPPGRPVAVVKTHYERNHIMTRSEGYDLGYTQAEMDAYDDAKDEARYMADDSEPSPPPGYTAEELERDNPFNQTWSES